MVNLRLALSGRHRCLAGVCTRRLYLCVTIIFCICSKLSAVDVLALLSNKGCDDQVRIIASNRFRLAFMPVRVSLNSLAWGHDTGCAGVVDISTLVIYFVTATLGNAEIFLLDVGPLRFRCHAITLSRPHDRDIESFSHSVGLARHASYLSWKLCATIYSHDWTMGYDLSAENTPAGRPARQYIPTALGKVRPQQEHEKKPPQGRHCCGKRNG